MFKMWKKSFAIPYDDNLIYPSITKSKEAVIAYCRKEGFSYEFNGVNEDGNLIVIIDGVPHEILRRLGQGQSGPGGYGISCREI